MSRKVIFHRSIRLIEKFDRSVLLLFPRFSTPRMYTTLLVVRCCYTRRRLSSREKVVGDETSGAEARKREREWGSTVEFFGDWISFRVVLRGKSMMLAPRDPYRDDSSFEIIPFFLRQFEQRLLVLIGISKGKISRKIISIEKEETNPLFRLCSH